MVLIAARLSGDEKKRQQKKTWPPSSSLSGAQIRRQKVVRFNENRADPIPSAHRRKAKAIKRFGALSHSTKRRPLMTLLPKGKKILTRMITLKFNTVDVCFSYFPLFPSTHSNFAVARTRTYRR